MNEYKNVRMSKKYKDCASLVQVSERVREQEDRVQIKQVSRDANVFDWLWMRWENQCNSHILYMAVC